MRARPSDTERQSHTPLPPPPFPLPKTGMATAMHACPLCAVPCCGLNAGQEDGTLYRWHSSLHHSCGVVLPCPCGSSNRDHAVSVYVLAIRMGELVGAGLSQCSRPACSTHMKTTLLMRPAPGSAAITRLATTICSVYAGGMQVQACMHGSMYVCTQAKISSVLQHTRCCRGTMQDLSRYTELLQ